MCSSAEAALFASWYSERLFLHRASRPLLHLDACRTRAGLGARTPLAGARSPRRSVSSLGENGEREKNIYEQRSPFVRVLSVTSAQPDPPLPQTYFGSVCNEEPQLPPQSSVSSRQPRTRAREFVRNKPRLLLVLLLRLQLNDCQPPAVRTRPPPSPLPLLLLLLEGASVHPNVMLCMI